jgi:hypothetical protein
MRFKDARGARNNSWLFNNTNTNNNNTENVFFLSTDLLFPFGYNGAELLSN